ncbi:MAG TPA: hypothetical protein EYP48_03270, partial [Ignisphaera sp.]|nr:hypothetical protein [Ignisphaera sp.]
MKELRIEYPRISVGLWQCTKCGAVWAGGAYAPRTGLNKHFPKI